MKAEWPKRLENTNVYHYIYFGTFNSLFYVYILFKIYNRFRMA